MIGKKTVLILGAGASVPYGFPTGADLRRDILMNLTSEENYQRFHALGYTDIGQLEQFREDFWRSQQPSIDAFLESRPDHLELGQLVISAFLIPKESKRVLLPDADGYLLGRDEEERDDWYRYLFQRMGPTKALFEYSLRYLSVITFNYDRSFEYYFFETLKYAYGLEDEQAAQLVIQFPVVHVYGLLAYPHFVNMGVEMTRDYEPHQSQISLRKAASMISIVRAGEKDGITEEQKKAHELIRQAKRVCFIGFGYDETNLERLKLPGILTRQELFGTGYRLEEDVRQRALPFLIYEDPNVIASIKPIIGDKNTSILDFLKTNLVFD